MRYIPVLILSLILLMGCAGQKVFNSKGVSYLEQPARELEACYKFTNPPVSGSEISTLPITGKPYAVETMIYMPVETNYMVNKTRSAYTTIYAIENDKNTVTDSLVLKQDGAKLSFRHIVMAKDLFIVGTKDTLMYIYRTDATLKIMNEYPTGFRLAYIADVSVFDGKLRIAGSTPDDAIVLYDIKTDTMQPERNRMLLRSFDHYDVDNGILWYFKADDTTLTTARIDLTANDPAPVFKSFDVSIPKMQDYQVYNVKAAGSTIYLSYSWFTDDAIGASKLISINYADGKMQQQELQGNVSFDVLAQDNKTYMFKTALVDKKQVMSLAEIKPDLSESTPLVTYFLADHEFARSILPYRDNKFFLTGIYNQKTGKTIIQEIPGMKKVKIDEEFPQAFLAIF